jgi:hypothetical protein
MRGGTLFAEKEMLEWTCILKPKAIQNTYLLLQEHSFGWALDASHDVIHFMLSWHDPEQ